MMPRSQPLSRRTLLRGAGACVALPFLEAMLPRAAAAAGEFPTRLGFVFMPNGVAPGKWTPKGEGKEFELSSILQPLSAHKDDLTVLKNLTNAHSSGGDGHYAKTANWLTGTPIAKTTGSDLRCGISVDQLLARERGHLTRLPSLELGTEPVHSGVDFNVNYTKLYGSYISWRTPTTPLPCEINPRHVFDRLFRNTPEQAREKATADRSVLDLVMEDAHSLRKKVGREDQARVEEYLESLRALERRIEAEAASVRSGQNLDPAVAGTTRKLGEWIDRTMEKSPKADAAGWLRLDHTEHSQIMMDLMALAFRTDTTRACSMMFGFAVSSKDFSFLDDVGGAHHEISHHGNKKDKLAQYERIGRWHSAQLAYLLDRLKEIPEGDGTLLENTLILYGSSMHDGNRHDPKNLPLLLAGRGGGLEPQGHLVSKKDTPLCDLYLSMLRRAGLPDLERFGDSRGALI